MVQQSKIDTVLLTTDRLERAQSVVLVDYKGLTVQELSELRGKLRENGSELKVIKNRLTRLALKETGCDALDDDLVGPIALAFGYTDPTGPAKVCSEYAKKNAKLEIRAGLLEKRRIGLDKIAALAKLPGRAELLAQMAATLLAPARQLATAMNQSMTKIVYAMKARAEQLEG